MKFLFLSVFISLFVSDKISGQTKGCTDKKAVNYNPAAIINDGSCAYGNASVSPDLSSGLSDALKETSGLLFWEDKIWTHNDNGDINLYSLDTANGNIIQSFSLKGLINTDWEEIAHDSSHIYVGDFGNNLNGNRTDLKILRIDKQSVMNNTPVVESINFSYSDQTDFKATGGNKTDFDCEAFVVTPDSIFLFTKQWVSNKTALYSLPNKPGTYTAQLKYSFDVQGLVTGSVFLEEHKIVALCGYTGTMQPFVWLLYDFLGHDFFGGNKRKISVSLPFHQIEGIATSNGLKYYISNEHFSFPPFVNNPQKLHVLDLSPFLADYVYGDPSTVKEISGFNQFSVSPNPVQEDLVVESDSLPVKFLLLNVLGQTVLEGVLTSSHKKINLEGLNEGLYYLKVGNIDGRGFKIIKL